MATPPPAEPTGTRGLPDPVLVVGEALQSISLGILERGDLNASFATRAVGLIILAFLLILGSLIASFASPLKETLIGSALTVPVVRADLMFLLFSRLVLVFVWASKLRPNKLLYANEVYPLQAAAMIWNDCRPIEAHAKGEDGHSTIVDILTSQRQLWKPTKLDTLTARLAKLPVFVIVFLLRQFFLLLERLLFRVLHLAIDRCPRNQTLWPVQTRRIRAPGHTALITDAQLTWVQDFTMRDRSTDEDALEQHREARRVLVRALHVANLLGHGGYTRLHEHSAGGHAMSEYFAAVGSNKVVKGALSKLSEVGTLNHLPNGNKLVRGAVVPGQVMWARLLVGSMRGLRGEGRWRGPVAAAVFAVAQENMRAWQSHKDCTPLHRHVHTVSRRWLVDWLMFMWWEVDVSATLVYDPAGLFERLVDLLRENLTHNTMSLPHAVGEMALAGERTPDVEVMLARMLGDDWEAWLNGELVARGGGGVRDAAGESDEWKCFKRTVDASVTLDSALYKEKVLGDVIDVGEDDGWADQVRARFARRIVETYVKRIRDAWIELPHLLLDPPEGKLSAKDRLETQGV